MKDPSRAYITEQERLIVEEWHMGSSPEEIAESINMSPEYVRRKYTEIMEKVDVLLPWKEGIPLKRLIDEFLKEIGIRKCMSGGRELATAIYLGIVEPELMDQMRVKFFPELGKMLNTRPETARRHVTDVIYRTYAERLRNGLDVSFFHLAGDFEINITNRYIRGFIEQVMYYIVENSPRFSQNIRES